MRRGATTIDVAGTRGDGATPGPGYRTKLIQPLPGSGLWLLYQLIYGS